MPPINTASVERRKFEDGTYTVLIPGVALSCGCGSDDVFSVSPGSAPFESISAQVDLFGALVGSVPMAAVEASADVALCRDCWMARFSVVELVA